MSMSTYSRFAATALFVSGGVMHFVRPGMYRAIVPPTFPAPDVLVAVSGAGEIAGAVGLAFRATRRPAALGLIALLVAVFPANIYMAVAHARFATVAPAWALVARLPVQAVLIAWMWSLRD